MKHELRRAGTAILVAVLALAVAGLWWSSGRDAGTAAASTARAPVAPSHVDATLVAAAPIELEAAPAAPAEPVPAAPVDKRTSARPKPEAARTTLDPFAFRRMEGRIVVLDEEGGEIEPEDGRLHLDVGGRMRFARVTDGHWWVHARPNEILRPTRIVIDGFRAWLTEGRTSLRIPESEPILLEVEHLPGIELRVVDDETGVHLTSFDLFEGPDGSHPGRRPDWLDEPSLAGLASPHRLKPVAPIGYSTERTYWVRDAMHACTSFQVDFEAREPTTVRLESAGALVVDGLGVLSRNQIWNVRLRRPGSAVSGVDLPIEPGQARLEVGSLPLGEWVAGLTCVDHSGTVDPSGEQQLLVDSVAIEILPDRTTWLRFDRIHPLLDASVPLAGTLQLGPGGRAEHYWIELRRSDSGGAFSREPDLVLRGADLDTRDGRSARVQWDAGFLPPGLYQVLVGPSLESVFVDLIPPGRSDVELAVRETAPVIVHLVESETGAALPFDEVSWAIEEAHGDRMVWIQDEVSHDPLGLSPDRGRRVEPSAEGLAEIRLPVGAVSLLFALRREQAGGIRRWGRSVLTIADIEVLPGENEFTIRVRTRTPELRRFDPEIVRHEVEER